MYTPQTLLNKAFGNFKININMNTKVYIFLIDDTLLR